MSDLATLAEAEVQARHRFFVDWFTGRGTEAAMAETAQVFASDMRMIAPDGSQQDAPTVVAMLRRMQGARPVGFAIRIDLRGSVPLGPDDMLVLYDEHQTDGQGTDTSRRSTAIFSREGGLPGGVVWRHLHETWTKTA